MASNLSAYLDAVKLQYDELDYLSSKDMLPNGECLGEPDRYCREFPAPDYGPALSEAAQNGTYQVVAPLVLALAEVYRLIRIHMTGRDYDQTWEGYQTAIPEWPKVKRRFDKSIAALAPHVLVRSDPPAGADSADYAPPVRANISVQFSGQRPTAKIEKLAHALAASGNNNRNEVARKTCGDSWESCLSQLRTLERKGRIKFVSG